MSDKRFNQIKKMLLENPNDSFLRFALAKEYEKKSEWILAIELYQNIIDADPDYIGAYYHLGKAHEITGALPKAMEIYSLGIDKAKELKDFHSLSELNTAKTNLEIDLD